MTIVSHTEPNDLNIFARDDYYFNYDSAPFKAIDQADEMQLPMDQSALSFISRRKSCSQPSETRSIFVSIAKNRHMGRKNRGAFGRTGQFRQMI